jgi:hypothetical protein
VSDQLFPDADAHVIDTDLFIAFERNGAVNLLERSVSEHDVTLFVPQRVYDELTPENLPYDTPPIEAGWVQVLDEVDYANPVVSSTMDMVRRYISAADERAEHTVEQADAEVGGATATLLEQDAAESVAVYTNDVAAFRGIERALTEQGYEQQVRFVKSFDLFDDVRDRYRFQD